MEVGCEGLAILIHLFAKIKSVIKILLPDYRSPIWEKKKKKVKIEK